MSSKKDLALLSQAHLYLINEEHSKAEELFHTYLISKARAIHESLRNGSEDTVFEEDDVDSEINSEKYFSEDDLDGMEDGAEGEEGFEGGDEESFGDDTTDEELPSLGDEEDVITGDEMDTEKTTDEKIDDIEQSLELLLKKFDELSGFEEEEHDIDVNNDGMVDGEESGEGEELDPEMGDEENFGGEEETGEGEEEGEEEDFSESLDWDDLTESLTSELERIAVSLNDGDEIGTGKKITQNKESPIPMKKANDRKGAKPVETGRGPTHSGYEREQAPSTKDVNVKSFNAKKKATDGRKEVSPKNMTKDGSPVGSGGTSTTVNDVSPIGGRGTTGNNGGVNF